MLTGSESFEATPLIIDVVDDQASNDQTFYYLQEFTKEELQALSKKYQRNLVDLELHIMQHQKYFWGTRIKNYFSLGSNLFYVVFQINTSKEGLESFVTAILPQAKISNAVGYGIGTPLAVIDSLLYFVTYSARKEALLSTIQYALKEPLSKRMQNVIYESLNKPCGVFLNLFSFTTHQSILMMVNVAGTVTEIIDIKSLLDQLPQALKWSFIMTILYFGYDYHVKYMNPDYYDGVLFWQNKNHRPWLIEKIREGHLALSFRVFLQGISATGLRAYPFYYYLGMASSEIFGIFTPPAWVIAVAAFIHSLCALYPTTYDYYLLDGERLKMILDELFRDEIDLKVKQKKIQLQKIDLEKKVIETYGHLFLFNREPQQVLTMGFLMLVGGYFGFSFLGPLLMLWIQESASMHIGGILLGSSLLTFPIYRGERERVLDKLMLKEMTKDIASEDHVHFSTLVQMGSLILSIGNGVSGAMGTLGTCVRIVGKNSPVVLTTIAVIAFENMLNGIFFNWKKITSVLDGLRSCVSKRAQHTFSLFSPSKKEHSQSNIENNNVTNSITLAPSIK